MLGLGLSLLFTAEAFALTVSPIKLETVGNPGETVRGEVILLNEKDEEATYYSSFERFDAQGESGTPVFTTSTEGLTSWISIRESVTLQPLESVSVPYIINIPADAPAGGNFAAIFWNSYPPNAEGGAVSLGAKVGILLLLSISGEVTESGDLLEFGIENKQTNFATLPINFWYRFRNNGADRVKPSGTITVKNTFGVQAAQFNANPGDGNALPTQTRLITASWIETDRFGQEVKPPADQNFMSMALHELNHFRLGRYTATLNLEYGKEGKTASGKVAFLIIPWHALALTIPVIFTSLLLGIITLRRYNRWIIKRANEQKV